MITYNDIYEAAKRNLLFSFKLPQNTEQRFLITREPVQNHGRQEFRKHRSASGEIASQLQGVMLK